MEDISIIITIIATVIGLSLTFVGLIWKFFKHFDDKFDRKIDDIKKDLSENQKIITQHGEKLNFTEKALDGFQKEFREISTEIYQMIGSAKKYTGNPISPEEKENLIKKMKQGTIRRDEAEKLKRILEEEKREAEKGGDIVTAIAIGLLLAALAYLLYKLMSEGE